MALYTQGALSVGYTQDDLEAAPESVRSATFEQALSDLPGWSLVRAERLAEARRYGGIAFRSYQPDEAEQYMAERGLQGQFSFDRPYNGDELRILADRKQKELKRAYVLARADQSLTAGAGRLGIQLATSFLDPLAIATAFIPVVGEARYGAMLAKASGMLGRAGVRAGVGAVEGAVGAAVVEPIIYAAKTYEQADYSLADSMLNIALGGVFGGGLHAIGGAVSDIGRAGREAAAQARVAEFRKYLDQQDELKAPAPFTPLVEIERRLTVADVETRIEGLYKARRADLERIIAESPDRPEGPMRFDVTYKEAAQAELQRLDSAWMRAESAQDKAKLFTGEDGPLWKSLVDAERADNLTAVESRIAQLESARPAAEAALKAAEQTPESQIAGAPEARETAIRDAHRELRKIDGELTQLRPVAQTLTDQLKDAASVRVLRASPEAREAALGVGMAQAAAGEPIEVRPIFDRASWQEAGKRMADPDQAEFANADAVVHADQVLAAGETTEATTLQAQVDELDTQISNIEAEAKLMDDEVALEYLAGIREQVKALEQEASESSSHARMLAVCAMRHAA